MADKITDHSTLRRVGFLRCVSSLYPLSAALDLHSPFSSFPKEQQIKVRWAGNRNITYVLTARASDFHVVYWSAHVGMHVILSNSACMLVAMISEARKAEQQSVSTQLRTVPQFLIWTHLARLKGKQWLPVWKLQIQRLILEVMEEGWMGKNLLFENRRENTLVTGL